MLLSVAVFVIGDKVVILDSVILGFVVLAAMLGFIVLSAVLGFVVLAAVLGLVVLVDCIGEVTFTSNRSQNVVKY